MLRYKIIRNLAYTLELLVLSTLQQIPGLFPEIWGARPVLLLATVLVIALFETETTAMAFGIFGGLLIDFAGGGLLGFHGMILAVLCYLLATLYNGLIRANLLTALLTGAVGILIVVLLQWMFFFVFKGYAHAGYALVHRYLPRFLYTFVFVLPLYYVNRAFSKLLRPAV